MFMETYKEFLLDTLNSSYEWGYENSAFLRQMEIQTENLLLKSAREVELHYSSSELADTRKLSQKMLRSIWDKVFLVKK